MTKPNWSKSPSCILKPVREQTPPKLATIEARSITLYCFWESAHELKNNDPPHWLLLSGCAWQSDAMKIGEDTYQTSADASPARGGHTGAREMALANANKKCDELKKQIEVVDVKTQWGVPANGVATVTFKCK